MDYLTRERYGNVFPGPERHLRPTPAPGLPLPRRWKREPLPLSTPEQIEARREVLLQGDGAALRALRRARRLAEVIARWKA